MINLGTWIILIRNLCPAVVKLYNFTETTYRKKLYIFSIVLEIQCFQCTELSSEDCT